MERRAVLRLLSCGVAMLPLVACSSPHPEGARTSASDASWDRSYDSLDAVLAETTVVVSGAAVSQEKIPSTEDGSGLKNSTLTTFRIEKTLGERISEAKVRSTDGLPDGEAATYTVGQSYILFLRPFEFRRGVSTGTYIAVGQLAAYRLTGENAVRVTERDSLPVTISAQELLRIAKSALK